MAWYTSLKNVCNEEKFKEVTYSQTISQWGLDLFLSFHSHAATYIILATYHAKKQKEGCEKYPRSVFSMLFIMLKSAHQARRIITDLTPSHNLRDPARNATAADNLFETVDA